MDYDARWRMMPWKTPSGQSQRLADALCDSPSFNPTNHSSGRWWDQNKNWNFVASDSRKSQGQFSGYFSRIMSTFVARFRADRGHFGEIGHGKSLFSATDQKCQSQASTVSASALAEDT